jgi:DNA-binding NarL/FixJ family response regulator
MEPGKSILIMAQTGTLQMGLQALLLSISREHQIRLAGDSAQALELLRSLPASLALLEDNRTAGRIWDTVREIKRISSGTKCIVLLENVQQQTNDHAADAVILQGTPPEQLVAIIEGLLEETGI